MGARRRERLRGALGAVLGAAVLAMAVPAPAARAEAGGDRLDAATEIRPFVREVSRRDGLPAADVARILAAARVQPRVLDAMAHPAEAKPWPGYRAIFLTETRIAEGVAFWHHHADTLDRMYREFGVDRAIVVAILGVETRYGRRAGNTRVLDSLATLAFRYPRRAAFFRHELVEFLLLAHERDLDPLTTLGSYAGAMGIPQFIASSYRRYAVDFDHDGVRDLIGDPVDAIGSVGNYLDRHGWHRDAPVAFPAEVSGDGYAALVDRGLEPHTMLAHFAERGVKVSGADGDGGDLASLIALDGDKGPEYWAALGNFYVITRYNHSRLYAMAVYQLAQAIKARYAAPGHAG